MVRVTIAGGTSKVGREVIDALAAANSYEIAILTRSNASAPTLPAGVACTVVNYDDPESLHHALSGTHTLLSFLQLVTEQGQAAQKNLIDAAVHAVVKRVAPSEWSSKDFTDMPFYQNKRAHREQLAQLADDTGIEYTLFQPGLFLNYLAFPHKTSTHLDPFMMVFDFANRRAMAVDGLEDDAFITLTSVQDVAAAVVAMVDQTVTWPKISGICGNRLSARQIIDIGERVCGQPFAVARLKQADLEADPDIQLPWSLESVHHAVSADMVKPMLQQVAVGTLLSFSKGVWDCSDEVNKMLPPDVVEWTDAEKFLREVWG